MRITLTVISTLGILLSGFTQDLDSLENAYSQYGKRDTAYVQLLNDLSYEYLTSDPKKSSRLILEASRVADSIQDSRGKVWALINRGNYFWYAGMYDAALNWFYRAERVCPDKNGLQMLAIFNNIGEVFKRKDQNDSALNYLTKAIAITENDQFAQHRTLLLYNIGELHFKRNEVALARDFFNQASAASTSTTRPRHIAYALYGQGLLAENEGKVERAIALHDSAFSIRSSLNDIPGQIQSLQKLARLYAATNRVGAAKKLINEAIDLGLNLENRLYLSEAYLAMAELLESIQDHQQANRYLRMHFSQKDSLETMAFAGQVERIQDALESEIEEKDFLLLQQQRASQAKEIERKTIIIATISGLAVVLFIFFINYRKNLRTAQNQGRALNELNDVILAKNREIETINASLDHKLINTTKLLFESQKIAKLGSWEYHFDNKEIRWTDQTFHQLGLVPQKDKPSNELIKQFVSKEDYQRMEEAMARTKQSGIISDLSVPIQLPNGDKKYLRLRYYAELAKGKLIRVYGYSQDVTQRVETEEREKSIISSLLDLSKFANLLHYNFEDFIKYLLRQATETLNLQGAVFWILDKESSSLKNFKSIGLAELKPGAEMRMAEYPTYFGNILKNRTAPIANLEKSEASSQVYSQLYQPLHITSILDAKVEIDGDLVGLFSLMHSVPREWTFSDQRYVGSLTDIIATAYSTSLNKKLEKEKGELINKLFKKNQNLEELTYVVSHNMRGPLTQIMGLSQLYYDPQSKGLEEEIIGRINKSSLELDKVIKDLSEILKQQDEAAPAEELKLRDIVEETLNQVQAEWQAIESKIQISIRKDFKVYGQESQVQTVMYSLLTNAFKFRKPDQIVEINITARKRQKSLVISIADNGLGIDLKRYDMKIFRMYQRFHPHIEGAGIGLFITKNLVEAMGGTIEVTSTPMDGTIFTVELPDHQLLSVEKLNLQEVS